MLFLASKYKHLHGTVTCTDTQKQIHIVAISEDIILSEEVNLDFILQDKKSSEEHGHLKSVPTLFTRIVMNTTVHTYSLCSFS